MTTDINELEGFSKDQAHSLLGATLVKLGFDPDYPVVKPGRVGKVIRIEKSQLAQGYGLTVDWGDNEIWEYDCTTIFSADVLVISRHHPS